MLVFEAKIYKDGKQWLAEAPELDAMTQGKSKRDAALMLIDWVRSMLDDQEIEAFVHQRANGEMILLVESTPEMIGLYLQRQRIMKGLTVRQLASLLGFKSHNSYAQYERGTREPSFSELEKFLNVLRPKHRLRASFG